SAALCIGGFGVHYCLIKSAEATGHAAVDMKDFAKKMAYDMGSFAWPGWNEPGIQPSSCDITAGDDAARLNLRLAVELNRPPEGMSNAHWLIGAYAIVRQDWPDAQAAFSRAADFSRQAGDSAMTEFHLACGKLARRLESPNDSDRQRDFAAAIETLESLQTDDSTLYAQQLRTAHGVFSART
ncbi:MAG TPA: hypothetical protein VL992_19340, partial [Tepidisphaeraceae bacterium]|nr:hypothetical protein [Tepidisphaeraceae bacterium]